MDFNGQYDIRRLSCDSNTAGKSLPLDSGYGESTTLRRRNFESEVENIEDLANSLGVHKFYLAAVSGGGPYALAAASVIPHRLRGVLLLSAAGSPGDQAFSSKLIWK